MFPITAWPLLMVRVCLAALLTTLTSWTLSLGARPESGVSLKTCPPVREGVIPPASSCPLTLAGLVRAPDPGRRIFLVGACREMNLPSLVLMICPASGLITTFCGDFSESELRLDTFFRGLESKLGMSLG